VPRDTSSASADNRRRCTRLVLALLVFLLAWSAQRGDVAHAQELIPLGPAPDQSNEFLLHASPDKVQDIATRHGLTIIRTLDVPPYDVFLVRAANVATSGTGTADDVTPDQKVSEISSDPAVNHVEVNGVATAPEVPAGLRLDQSPVWILDALIAPALVDFGGQQVWNSYLAQPAATAIGLQSSRTLATGAGIIVAVIDTGVDPHHPVLQQVLVPGYDFVDDVPGAASEWSGVDPGIPAALDQSPVWILDAVSPVKLNQSTLAILDQPRAASLATLQLPAAFGHGTMVAGIVHLVAPSARIMPLKAFSATGTSRVFDIVRAIYYAVDHGARVINMSFSTPTWSPEITHAINTATDRGVICVASAGNLGQEVLVYPGAQRNVLGIGSTNAATLPVRSIFSNYGDSLVSLAAPGEGIITTYPGGGYAGAWGTSFSAPMVAGAAALLLQIDPTLTYSDAATLLGKANAMALSGMGKGRLNLSDSLRRAADSTAPTVAFVTPASGAVSHTISVSATATDNIAVAGVAFLVDNQPVGGELTSPPYNVSWNTATVANGSHVLTAVARDAAGNKSTATRSVTVTNDVTAPTVAVTNLGESVSGGITIAASATDDVGVAGVQFTVDGAPLGPEVTTAPFVVTWDTSVAANGLHVLTATARDAAHATTSSEISVTVANDVNVTVSNDTVAPTVALTTESGALAGSVTVTAPASDDVGVVGVQFLLDGEPVGAEDTTPAYDLA
jgi:subtilisin family serine protease